MNQRELANQLILGAIGVLIFVHQHVLKAPVVLLADLTRLVKELHGFQKQVIKIQGVGLPKFLFIKIKKRRDLFHGIGVGLFVHHLGRHAMILCIADF